MSAHATQQTAAPRRADPQRAATHQPLAATHSRITPIKRLQRTVGNRALSSLLRAPVIQRKLEVSEPDDEFEREADRVADEVMRMPEPASGAPIQRTPVQIHRFSSACEEDRQPAMRSRQAPALISRKCLECQQEEEEGSSIQAKRTPGIPTGTSSGVESYLAVSGGQPLSNAVRSHFEPRFGHDFSSVRIHTDARAAESARSVGALAYTVGRNIVFDSGQYVPNSDTGRRLLAHELTHVVQQRGVDSGVVHRQTPNPPTVQNPSNPPPTPARFSPTPGCIVDMTNRHVPVAPNTVTIIEYGATWCASCGEEQRFLVELCNEYAAARPAAPVRFFLVDGSDDSVRPTVNTWPPVPGTLPTVLIYSGQFQTFMAQGPTTKPQVKAAIDRAIVCARDPLRCSPLEEPAGGVGCTIQPAAVPRGRRYRFTVNAVNFAPGEEARLEADILAMQSGSRVDLLGLASSDGPVSTNRVLSCQRALTATAVFARHGIIVRSMLGTGPVAGTDNNADFRAVDVLITAPITPVPVPAVPTRRGPCAAPTCVPDFVISGPTTLRRPPKIGPGAPAPSDPRQLLQTFNCDPALYQIVTGPGATSNVRILHVRWRKEPPAGTLSVQRNAFDDTGDDPAPAQKAPSFAALNPITGASWATNVDAVGSRQACWTSRQVPSWCVPFCSFGRFTMFARVTWACDNTECTTEFITPMLNIDVQRNP